MTVELWDQVTRGRLHGALVRVVATAAFATSLMFSTSVVAQDATTDFAAFKQKIDMARQSSAVDDTEEDLGMGNSNPLGPAAALPVQGGLAIGGASALAPDSPEEMQARLEQEAEDQLRKLEEEAFKGALKQLLPLTPGQIRTTYEEFGKSREAAETPLRVPQTHSRVQTISLDPADSPPVLRLVPGYVTTLSILDSSGAPWPVQDITFAGKFEVTPPASGEHIIRIVPLSAHGVGNLSLRLVDLITPVIFTLNTGLDDVDYRFDARVPKPGPLAKTPLIEFGGLDTVAGTDGNLVSVLDGTPPAGAEKLVMRGADGRSSAWRIGGKIYLRTALTLLSPAWNASVSSADGTVVYALNETPIILLSDNGKMVRAQLYATD
ncbi:MAG: type IV secretion protein DotH [Alphaproteobacteria bacterium]|nr:type IV secretion protein DotH [Alphaproteobacteria bacterium]